MMVTRTVWLVYGTYNDEPVAMFFDNERDALEFMWECRMNPHVDQIMLAINRVKGINYHDVQFVAKDDYREEVW